MSSKSLSYIDKLPFAFGSDARKKRFDEAREKHEIPIEINCIGSKKYEIVGRKLIIRVFNEKINHWQEEIGVEYQDICCICGKLMLVRAIQGSTWLALCSKDCYDKYFELKKESETNG